MSEPPGAPPAPSESARASGDPKRWWWAVRIVAMVLSAAVGLVYLLLWVLLLNSALGSNPDPHGYTLIFSTFLMVPVGAVFCLVFPFCFRSGLRLRAALFVLLGFLALVVLAFVVLSWAS